MREKSNCFDENINPKCFNLLTEDEWKQIGRHQTRMQYKKGEHLARQGSPSAVIIFILEGLVKQFIESETSRPFNTAILQPGDFIGLSTLFGDTPFITSAMALQPVEACLISSVILRDVITKNNTLALKLIERHLSTERHLIDIVARLNYKQMPGKLAQTLLYLNQEHFAEKDLFSLLTRNDLADFAAISSINVVKLLHQFEDEGIIKLNGKKITVTDKEALHTIAKNG